MVVCSECGGSFEPGCRTFVKKTNQCVKCYSRLKQRRKRADPVFLAQQRERAKVAYWENPAKENTRWGIWYSKSKDRVSAYRKNRTAELKKQVYDLLGRFCARCGFSDSRALQIDHIHGGGNKEKRELKTRSDSRLFLHILQHTNPKDVYQILCANCNWIKKHENNEI